MLAKRVKKQSPKIRFDRLRIGLVLLFFLFLFGLVARKLIYFQVVERENIIKTALLQYQKPQEPEPVRGTIYSRNGKEFAVSIPAASVYMVPQETDQKAITQVANLLGIGTERLQKKKSKRFVWIKRKIPPQTAIEIEEMKLAGIHLTMEERRVYIDKSLAGQLVGFVGVDNQGLEGVEYMFDQKLEKAGTAGGIRLTIDQRIQHIARKALQEACAKHQPKDGIALVMDPASGDILAMAVWPFYNPNRFNDYPPDTWRNKIISDRFEPGSIMKVFTAAAALEEKIYDPEDQIFCHNGVFRLKKGIVRDVKPLGWLSFSEVIEKSSNIGTLQIAQSIGKQRLFGYLKRFGFGRKTGIELPGENAGKLRQPNDWSSRSLSSVAFGQELSVTAIQFLTAFSSIVSDGNLVRPRIIMENNSTGAKKETRVISARTSRLMKEILVEAVENGTGKRAKIPGYRVGGKTGTAQVFDRKLNRYSPDKYISSFVGFAPADKPRITVLVAINQPTKEGYFGGLVAAPVFKRLTRETLEYMRIFPDQTVQLAGLTGIKKMVKNAAMQPDWQPVPGDRRHRSGDHGNYR